MPRSNLLTIRRGSGTPTASAFEVGEPAFDPSAGKLFIKGSSGMIEVGVASVAVYETVSAFPATGQNNVLYVDSSTSRLWRWESPIYVETGPVGGGGSGGSTTDASVLTSGILDDARLSANVVQTGDSRLSNSRTPTSHAASHAAAGSDPLTLSAGQIASGTLDDARLSFVPLHPFLLMGG